MCTIVVLLAADPRLPLAVVANRDEVVTRASGTPRVLRESPRAVGGIDLVSGGTWMGANEHGLFAGITNQRAAEPARPALRSRGRIVSDALALRDADEVEAMLRSVAPRQYSGFNLVFGTPRAVRVAYARPDSDAVEIERVEPGITVLANDRLRSPYFPKAERAELRAREALRAPALEQALLGVLADHELPSDDRIVMPDRSLFPREIVTRLQALCVHLPFYGTVSSTAMLWDEHGSVGRYLYASGSPCNTPFVDASALISRRSRGND